MPWSGPEERGEGQDPSIGNKLGTAKTTLPDLPQQAGARSGHLDHVDEQENEVPGAQVRQQRVKGEPLSSPLSRPSRSPFLSSRPNAQD